MDTLDGTPADGQADAFDTGPAADAADHTAAAPGRGPDLPPGIVLGLEGVAIMPEEVCIPGRAGDGHAPDDDALAELLSRTQTVAVVGMSPKPTRTSHGVAAWLLKNAHMELFWVNPVAAGQEVLGQPVYASLADLPVVPDMVDVFRRPEHVSPVVDEAISVGAKSVWLQVGIVDEESAARAATAGLAVVQNRCIKIEYRRLSDRIEALRTASA